MPDPDQGYLLNTIQNPRSLKPVYESVNRGNTTDDEIVDDTGLSDAAVDEGAKGLQRLGLLDSKDEEYTVRDYTWSTDDETLDFQLTALEHLASSLTPPEWGKQAVFHLNYAYLIKEDYQRINDNDEAVRKQMDRWERDTLEYYPTYRGDRIDLNPNKMENWGRLATYLGLLHQYETHEFTVYPDPSLIYHSIERAHDAAGRMVDGNPVIEVPAYLDWLSNNLLYLPDDTGGVPAILSRSLYQLMNEERIRLAEIGDQGAVAFDRMPTHDRREQSANSIVITS
ncbi:hypothetical protein [Haloarcula sediminis]|uniref:hypothetical protein n=1 Tax=Haloarcula sediminis TaxID=3111777 RepID=UPI002D766AB5|nr:hypothetical protein [Haloarcula sp. CK38]